MAENKKIAVEDLFRERREVLAGWKTGRDPLLDMDSALEYARSVPEEQRFSSVLTKAKASGSRVLIQPRAGVPDIVRHIELLRYLQDSGADFLPTTIDSYTRQNRYEEAERGLEESVRAGRAMLNGFPAVNHGVAGCRRVREAVCLPVQARHGTPDARLLAEIILAAGWTSFEGGAISYNVPYAKNVSLEDSIRYWQYCDRLAGFYGENGAPVNRESFGPLTGTLVPPSVSIAVGIIEALLAAEQGVKSVSVGYGMGGNINQDVAAVRVLRKKTEEYLAKEGHGDVEVSTVFHQWMGGFPPNESDALGLIAMSSVTGALSGATKMITKTPHESVGVPTKEANGEGIKASKIVARLLEDQRFPDCKALSDEIEITERETDCLMRAVYSVGKGDVAHGAVRAFAQGLVDIPFAPSKFNAGLIMPARDRNGCIRVLDFGNLAFDEDIREFHRKKIAERAAAEGREVSFMLTVDDVYAVSKGHMVGHPSYRN